MGGRLFYLTCFTVKNSLKKRLKKHHKLWSRGNKLLDYLSLTWTVVWVVLIKVQWRSQGVRVASVRACCGGERKSKHKEGHRVESAVCAQPTAVHAAGCRGTCDRDDRPPSPAHTSSNSPPNCPFDPDLPHLSLSSPLVSCLSLFWS